MDCARYYLAVPGILITTFLLVVISVKLKENARRTEENHDLVESIVLGVIGVVQLNFWDILFFGINNKKDYTDLISYLPVIVSLLYYLFVVHPLRHRFVEKK